MELKVIKKLYVPQKVAIKTIAHTGPTMEKKQ